MRRAGPAGGVRGAPGGGGGGGCDCECGVLALLGPGVWGAGGVVTVSAAC